MKKVKVLTQREQNEISGGLFDRKHRTPSMEDWNPNIGWIGSGPGGEGTFLG